MTLSEHQTKVLAAFEEKDKDIPISRIYLLVYGHDDWQRNGNTVRKMQQRLAPTFKHINDKLYKEKGTYHVIELGNVKRTYRLSTIRG